jgi:hypothetical protein
MIMIVQSADGQIPKLVITLDKFLDMCFLPCFIKFLSMDAQTNSLGPTQPVPSFVSSRSARSQTLSRLDVCAKFVTTTADGRTEGMSSTLIPLGSDNHQ